MARSIRTAVRGALLGWSAWWLLAAVEAKKVYRPGWWWRGYGRLASRLSDWLFLLAVALGDDDAQ